LNKNPKTQMERVENKLQCLCGSRSLTTIFTYNSPPKDEIRFDFSSSGQYKREVLRCDDCGHFISVHNMNDSALYSGDYTNSNYGEEEMMNIFNRIISLDPAESDNTSRVQRVLDYATSHFHESSLNGGYPSILDVGSGLCVFLYSMKKAKWDCTAIDSDPRSIKHAIEVVGVKGVCGNFLALNELGKFNVITFNKVLEHVKSPVEMLTKAGNYLDSNGFIYIEVPDGEAAVKEGSEREEFTIDHPHVYSAASLSLLIYRSGLVLQRIERLREPSSKYTLRAFLTVI
jgi:2-polyprenyl-3-methyl-5-hydroxy-6-metoxy-1,4-benzoquinol methylase